MWLSAHCPNGTSGSLCAASPLDICTGPGHDLGYEHSMDAWAAPIRAFAVLAAVPTLRCLVVDRREPPGGDRRYDHVRPPLPHLPPPLPPTHRLPRSLSQVLRAQVREEWARGVWEGANNEARGADGFQQGNGERGPTTGGEEAMSQSPPCFATPRPTAPPIHPPASILALLDSKTRS